MQFLPGSELLIPASTCSIKPRVFIAVDVPTLERIGDASILHDEASITFTIDHHAVETCMADFNYVDPDASATCLSLLALDS